MEGDFEATISRVQRACWATKARWRGGNAVCTLDPGHHGLHRDQTVGASWADDDFQVMELAHNDYGIFFESFTGVTQYGGWSSSCTPMLCPMSPYDDPSFDTFDEDFEAALAVLAVASLAVVAVAGLALAGAALALRLRR